jgi:SET domain-containing protein
MTRTPPAIVLDESDNRFHAAPSTVAGAGQGLFARVPLKAGERLEVIGVRVRPASASDRHTAFADEYKLRCGDDLLIPCGIASLANHSSHPNLRKVVDGGVLFLELVRDVNAGEELCFTYSDYARERYGLG